MLAVAPSNVAVDNIVERLAVRTSGAPVNIVRLGHPARMAPAILSHCLDAKVKVCMIIVVSDISHGSLDGLCIEFVVQEAEGTSVVDDVRTELSSVQKQRSKSRDKSARRELQAEERRLRKEIRVREELVVHDVIKACNVVCTTNIGAGTKVLQELCGGPLAHGPKSKKGGVTTTTTIGEGGSSPLVFDVVVIDEAAQAIEASCWIPLMLGKRCVLAGDHLQLPPTVTSKEAEVQGLNVTIVDRVAAR